MDNTFHSKRDKGCFRY